VSVRVLSVVLSVLAVLVMSATGPAPEARAAVDGPVLAHALAQDSEESSSSSSSETAEEGPELDPQTEAEAQKNRSRIVVGIIAAALLGIVAWGRYLRSKKAKSG
jgi:hypothetical protein